MTLAATFLGGAKSRLLPASVPFRFFAAAALFHVLLWFTLLVAAEAVVGFRGGPGPGLAAVHLLTLGVLTVTAIGAAVQLLPVATRRSLAAVWPIKLVFWLVVPGTALLAAGMFVPAPALMTAAGVATVAGLLLFAWLFADNLLRAGDLPVVAAYGWTALAALVLLTLLGLALILNFELAVLPDQGAAGLAHMVLGGFGFMGLLAVGFSHVLVPMFALSPAPAQRPSFVAYGLAAAGVALGGIGALAGSTPLLTLALLAGLGASALHLYLMRQVLRSGMRKRLGLSFLLIRGAWVMLPVTLLIGLAALYDLAGPNGAALFGFLLLAGWLLTFLLGVLQRILPFLASMHAGPAAGGGPMLLSELADSGPLRMHAASHAAAVLLVAAAIAIDAAWLARLGSAFGILGAVAFAWFTGEITWRVISWRVAAAAAKPR